jgi:hypothetical protein
MGSTIPLMDMIKHLVDQIGYLTRLIQRILSCDR